MIFSISLKERVIVIDLLMMSLLTILHMLQKARTLTNFLNKVIKIIILHSLGFKKFSKIKVAICLATFESFLK